MRIAGGFLIVLGLIWIILCFVGIAMMSRSVDYVTEAVLPSLLGVGAIAIGLWMLTTTRR